MMFEKHVYLQVLMRRSKTENRLLISCPLWQSNVATSSRLRPQTSSIRTRVQSFIPTKMASECSFTEITVHFCPNKTWISRVLKMYQSFFSLFFQISLFQEEKQISWKKQKECDES